jgi:hypothetical protein
MFVWTMSCRCPYFLSPYAIRSIVRGRSGFDRSPIRSAGSVKSIALSAAK